MKQSRFIVIAILALAVFIAGCAPSVETDTAGGTGATETVYRIGAVAPLTGEGASYGQPTQRVVDKAVADLNAEWKTAGRNKRLEVLFEDGKCNGKDTLTAAQTLVNIKGVKVIAGGECSGGTLGMAPFTEANKILVFSSISSSPEVTKAGDYVFRNYPSDSAQVAVMAPFIIKKGHKKIAILSENTDYAQALRKRYVEAFKNNDIEIVADEVNAPNAKDVRSELLKIKNAEPDALVLLPQTVPMASIYAKQIAESKINARVYGNDVVVLDETVKLYGARMEGYYGPVGVFDSENSGFKAMIAETDCQIGFYCATAYDEVFLLGEVLEKCGDSDTDCMRDALYATKDWEGKYAGKVSFDSNGDIEANFEVLQVQDGKLAKVK